MLRWLTAGESHGEALTAILDGLPAGVEVTSDTVGAALARRRLGHGRGSRQKFEQDALRILGGVRHGVTMGGPVALEIANSEWPKWETVMSADPVDPAALLIDAGTGDEREVARNKKLTRPRPGHADLAGMLKFGLDEARPILERASARETAARVALGSVAAAFLDQAAGIRLVSHVVRIGPVALPEDAPRPTPGDVAALDADPVRCLDPETSAAMIAEVDGTKAAGDTVGGIAEVLAYGLPIGLGSHTQWDTRLDADLAQALMSIQSVKGVGVGDGFDIAALRGSQAQDEILRDAEGRLTRTTNHAGGTEGGMSNGQPLRVRAAFKPISTVPRALRTIDTATGQDATALHQRSDACHVPPGAVIAEAMTALVLARAVLGKFGGDSVAEVRRNLDAYTVQLPEYAH